MVAAAEKAQKDALLAKINNLRQESPIEDLSEKKMIDAIVQKKIKNDEINMELNQAHHKSINPVIATQPVEKIVHQPMTVALKPAIVNEVNTKKIVTNEAPSSQITEANGDVVINLR